MSDNNFKIKHGLEVASGVTINAGGITVTGTAALDSITLTTPLPAIYGGTGTSTASGSGDLVLSTSPVFHTSVLTDSASFNLINTTATTVNFAGAATALNLGAGTGITTVNNNLHVAGDLTYDGQATVIQASPIAVDQPLIYLADGNTADTLDQGVLGTYSTNKYAGLIRDASDAGTWKLFSNLLTQPGNTADFASVTYDNLKIGALNATTGTFSAGVSGTTGTFSAGVSGTTGTFTAGVSGTTGTFTGAVTAPSFVSNVATGSAPFTVTSATPVSGLNIGGYAGALKSATTVVSVSAATAPTAGQVLTATNGTTATWTTPAATGVTSVVGAGTVNGLTLTGTVTSTGNLTLGGTLSGVNLASAVTGTLPVANGGTGVTTSTGTGAVVLGTSPAITTSLTTPSTSFDLVNTTATTVNIAGAATILRFGAGTGTTTINNNLQVAGTITYNGTANQLSPTNLSVSDSLIFMSEGNVADILDIGILGHYSTSKYSGFVRDASDTGTWKLFSNITATPGATVDFSSATYDNLYIGNLYTNQITSRVATGTAPFVVSSATPVSGLNIGGYSSALKSATTIIDVSAATAPTAGQVLTATDGTTAVWSNQTSVNKVTITAPATSATLTIADGGVLATVGANSLTLTTTAETNVTLPTSGTLITDAVTTLISLSTVDTITTGTWSASFGAVSGATLTNLTAANLTGTIPSTVLGNSSVYLGTTAVALNRATGSMVLSGVSIDGAAGSLTTATGAVVVSAATAPTIGQVLMATSGTAATWQTIASGSSDLSTATGTLAVANGGTGVTTSTGTGAVVLGTSPAITTSLTTPSTTFNLVNATATTVNFASAATAINIGASTGTTNIKNNLQVEGTITFGGTANQLSATNLSVDDALIYIGAHNVGDIVDLGIIAAYNYDGENPHPHAGIVRDSTDGVWKIFSGIVAEPGNTVDFSDAGAVYDDLRIGKLTTTGVNKVTITAPATSATLTLAEGSSLITSGAYSTTLTATATTALTLPTSGTLLADSASVNIGTSSVALNRSSGTLSLTGVNIDGSAGALKTASGSVVVSAATAPTTGQVLTATSGTTATWQTISSGGSGTVTSVGLTVPTFLTVTNSPVTGSGTLAVTLSGTALPVANGGTGATTSTGTGAVVLAGTPTLTTPVLGVATATSVNKVAITAPTTSATLTLADGSSLITSGANSITFTSTGTTSVTLPTSGTLLSSGSALGTPSSGTLSSCTGLPVATGISGLGTGVATFLATPSSANLAAAVTDESGTGTLVFTTTVNGVDGLHSDISGNLRSIPQNNKTSAYQLVASDNGKNINITTGGITIPVSVFASGDVISIYNQSGTAQNISWSGPTVYVAGTSTAKTSPASLAARGILTIMFVTGGATPEIVISGNV